MNCLVCVLVLIVLGILRGQTLDIRIDGTKSIPQEARSMAIATLSQQLPELVKVLNPRRIVVGQFGDAPWMSPTKDVPVPSPAPHPCPSPKMPAEVESIQSLKEAMIRRAEEACRVQQSRAKQQHQTEISSVITMVQAAIAATSAKDYSCTAIWDLLALTSITNEPTTFIVITDGRETCSGRTRSAITKPPADVRVVLLLTPNLEDSKRGRSMAIAFNETKQNIRASAPWVLVQPVSVGNLSAALRAADSGRDQVTPAELSQSKTAPRGGRPDSVMRGESRTSNGQPLGTQAPLSVGATSVTASVHRVMLRNVPVSYTPRMKNTEGSLRELLVSLHSKHVRPSFGPYDGECFTDQMLQEMISTDEPKRIAELVKSDRRFQELIAGLTEVPKDERSLIYRSWRSFASHKTWSELGGRPTPKGQTVAGVRAEALISEAVVGLLEELTRDR